MVVVLRFMDAFRKFEGIQQLTSGGPGLASTPINLHIYTTGLYYHRVGYAAAWGRDGRDDRCSRWCSSISSGGGCR